MLVATCVQSDRTRLDFPRLCVVVPWLWYTVWLVSCAVDHGTRCAYIDTLSVWPSWAFCAPQSACAYGQRSSHQRPGAPLLSQCAMSLAIGLTNTDARGGNTAKISAVHGAQFWVGRCCALSRLITRVTRALYVRVACWTDAGYSDHTSFWASFLPVSILCW